MPIKLGPAQRLRAAFHVLRTGDHLPSSAYLRGVRDGLDRGLAVAWDEWRRRFPNIGPAPEVPAEPRVSAFHKP